MRYAIIGALVLLASCKARREWDRGERFDTTDVAGMLPLRRESTDPLLGKPRTIVEPTVVVFWLHAADTLQDDDRADAFDANNIALLATRADTVYVTLAGKQRRTIVLSGLDYPYGYVLVDPGGPEQILTGVYSDDDLLDEARAYFDLPDASGPTVPKATT